MSAATKALHPGLVEKPRVLTAEYYRAEIDGLRAIAVLAVIGFHAFPDHVPGGFVGVDVFFVISGFLISSIILRQLSRAQFTIADFYSRRIRRIFPALLVVLAACLLFGSLVLLPIELEQLGKHIGSAAIFASNFTLWLESGYFDKLRATPVSRTALVLGRLYAEFVKTAFLAALLVAIALPFGIRIESGVPGFLVLILMISLWAAVFNGFVQLIALATRNAAATQSGGMIFFPLLFLTPNFVPRHLLTRPMEVAATYNPVTYIMEGARSLVLEGFDGAALLRAFAVIVGAGIVMVAVFSVWSGLATVPTGSIVTVRTTVLPRTRFGQVAVWVRRNRPQRRSSRKIRRCRPERLL